LKKYFLVLFAASSLLAEDLTFKCDWESSLEYLPRTRDHIPFRSSKGWGEKDIDNLCTQRKFEEVARTGNAELAYIWKDEFCLEKEITQISVNTKTKTFKIDGKPYKTIEDNSERECFGEKDKLCKYQTSGFRFDDDVLKIWVQTKYQLEECPIGLKFGDIFISEDKKRRDALLDACFGFEHSGNDWDNNLKGSTLSIEIDRNTLDFTRHSREERILFEDGNFVKEISKSGDYSFSEVTDLASEYGVCKVFKKQF